MSYRNIERTRIGGEFELDAASLFGGTRKQVAVEQAPYALPCAHAYWTDTGRSALLLVARDILRRGGAPLIWMPAFCCASVTQAFLQAGFTIRHYGCTELHGGSDAEPDPKAGQTVLLVHYFGHVNRFRLARAAAWRRREVFVIEDAAQAAFTREVGSAGHYAITSLRKFVPQPDGALVGSEFPLSGELAEPDEQFVSGRVFAKLLRGAGAAPEIFLPLLARSEARLDSRAIIPRRPSWVSQTLMARTDFRAVAVRRRHNWQVLRRTLRGPLEAHLMALHDTLEPGEVPLGLAVRVGGGRREALRKFLAEQAVYCPVHWRLPHVPEVPESTADHALSREILTLPIDQRLQAPHLRRFGRLLRYFFGAA